MKGDNHLDIGKGFEAINNSKIIGFVLWDINAKIHYANEQFLNLIDYSLEELNSGKVDWRTLTPLEFQDKDKDALRQLKASGSCVPYEKVVIRKDGKHIPILVGGSFIKDSQYEGVSFVLDISKNKDYENKLKESERRFKALVQYNPIGIIEADFEGKLLYANDSFLNMVGYARKDFEKGLLNWVAMTPEEHQNTDKDAVDEIVQKGTCKPFEKEYIKKDGSRIWVEIGVTRFDSEKTTCICFVQDITNRKKNEETLQESELRFRNMADSAPVLIWMADTNKLCFYFNKVWLGFTGRGLEKELGNGWLDGVHPDDLEKCMSTYVNSFDARKEFKMEYRLRRHDGVYRWILDSGSPRYNVNGAFVGYIGSCVDITERKEIEENLEQIKIGLEKGVAERTSELALANDILQKEVKEKERVKSEIQRSKNQLQAVVDSVPGAVSWFNSNLEYLGVNKFLAENFNLHPKDFVGKKIGFLDNESTEFTKFVEHFFKNQQKQSSKEISISLNGNINTYLVIAQKYYEGEAAVFVSIDITNQKRVEAELNEAKVNLEKKVNKRTSELINANVQLQKEIKERSKTDKFLREREERFRALVENSHDAIALIDSKGHLLYSGEPSMKRILGYSNEELFAEGQFSIIHPKDKPKVRPLLKKLIENPRKMIRTQYRLRHKNGSWKTVEAVLKNMIDEPSIGAIVINYSDATKRIQADKKIRKLAFYDKLTGVANRVLFADILEDCLQTSKKCAVLFIDIDRFKNVNDTLGHDSGDKVLKEISRRLKESIDTKTCTLGRLGGDEFAIVIPNIIGEDDIDIITAAENILDSFSKPINVKNNETIVSPSIGISIYPDHATDVDKLIRYADMAMYAAKKKQGNTYHYFTEKMSSVYMERLQIEKDLRYAISRNELSIFYQPKVNLQTKKIIGLEALIRWKHPKFGYISPEKFIPIAEETGMMNSIGHWVLENSCIQLKNWLLKGFNDITVAVNVSDTQLQIGFPDKVKNILEKVGLDPKSLEIELTETDVMHDDELKFQIMKEIQEQGISVSIDDFGTGYSSLSRLAILPINSLKIDQSFVRKLNTDKINLSIVKTIIDLARNLDLKVIAEGVEYIEQSKTLKDLHCDVIQGYYISQPLEANEVEKMFGNKFEV